MTNTYFVTETDAEVGETITSCALLQAARQLGLQTIGYKSMASGNEMMAEGLRNSNALALQCGNIVAMDYVAINPYTFVELTLSHVVSVDEGHPIQASVTFAGLRSLEEQVNQVLVEDAGGQSTPPPPALSFSDWVKAEQPPMILVVGVKLGCINHAILTARTVQQAGLTLAGRVASDMMPPGRRHTEYMATLECTLAAPLLREIPWLAEEPG